MTSTGQESLTLYGLIFLVVLVLTMSAWITLCIEGAPPNQTPSRELVLVTIVLTAVEAALLIPKYKGWAEWET